MASWYPPPPAAGYPYGNNGGSGYPPPGGQPSITPGYPYAVPPYGAHPAACGAGGMFAALVPSTFAPGTDPAIVACFQAADRDGSGMIDDRELQAALSGYNYQSFSLRTVHLLMYLFTNTNLRVIGN
jgi:calcium-binding protein CML